jgi:hypothetical protein
MALEYGSDDRVRTDVGNILVKLVDDADGSKGIIGRVDLLDQDGLIMGHWHGPLEDHLTPAQKSGLTNFLDALRLQAETQLLP